MMMMILLQDDARRKWFLDEEAVLSGSDDASDDEDDANFDQMEASFIDDATQMSQSQAHSVGEYHITHSLLCAFSDVQMTMSSSSFVVVPSCFRYLARTSPHRVREAPQCFDRLCSLGLK